MGGEGLAQEAAGFRVGGDGKEKTRQAWEALVEG